MPRRFRLVFFGTPDFALPSLQALCEAGRTPALVVSQPARPVGRGRRLRQPAVAAWAEERGLELAQPERVREPLFLKSLRELRPDVAVVVAFGQIFPRELLDLPRHACVNVHGSLLPRWRGAAPIQAAIRARDAKTGVTTMRMEEGLDTGPMLRAAATPLEGREDAGSLSARLAHLGAAVLLETLEALEAGRLDPRHQDEAAATYAPRLTKEDGRVDWGGSSEAVDAHVRAMTPWPGAFTELGGESLRIQETRPVPGETSERASGTLLAVEGDGVLVACGEGSVISVEEVQRPGRRAVTGRDLWNGERLSAGERLGREAS